MSNFDRTKDVPSWTTSQIFHEIAWSENKIGSLQEKLKRRPRTQREINDLQRQIDDRKAILRLRGLSVCLSRCLKLLIRTIKFRLHLSPTFAILME